jgi:hypothetical protein
MLFSDAECEDRDSNLRGAAVARHDFARRNNAINGAGRPLRRFQEIWKSTLLEMIVCAAGVIGLAGYRCV